ncbi:hypothetical protein [Leisingera methylohalidivorans]|uniref:Uncharacterized protein n=1 Tax=Leisingera methylohalidivorans DSM 14336 TaxID=999552 RepID=V9VWE2_9RHOB|nr:hypothetical protein [Leisingera methylohalidivorans]AHD03091.1 hypothetical protein METH_11235 [Leisingera methylohalidivorans DSM 14336]
MPTTKDDIRDGLRRSFSVYATRQGRAYRMLGGRLAILKQNAALARISEEEFAELSKEEMERAAQRMEARQQDFHPVTAVPAVEEVTG